MRGRKDSWHTPRKPLNPNEKTERKKRTAEFLIELQEKHNLSNKDIADILELAPGSIKSFKNATRELPEKHIQKLRRMFGAYESNEVEEETLFLQFPLIESLKKFNINENEFKCIKQYFIKYFSDKLDISLSETENQIMLEHTDESVIYKYISKNRLQDIHSTILKIIEEYIEKIKARNTFNIDVYNAILNEAFSIFCDITEKDVVNINNIPCFHIENLDVSHIWNNNYTEMYIELPTILTNDSYNYFAVILNDDFKCKRYHSQDILIIRQGESFAFDYDDELLVLENNRFILKSFEYIDYEEHQHIISVTDFAIDEKHEYSTNAMQDIKVIGTVVAILPRVLQDKKEKENGIFNRRLRTLND